MAKFRVKVTIKIERSYEVEVDANSEAQAEDNAIAQGAIYLPDAFYALRDGEFETETEQQTTICPECQIEHTISTRDRSQVDSDCWFEDYEYCRACGEKIEAEEKGNASNT